MSYKLAFVYVYPYYPKLHPPIIGSTLYTTLCMYQPVTLVTPYRKVTIHYNQHSLSQHNLYFNLNTKHGVSVRFLPGSPAERLVVTKRG